MAHPIKNKERHDFYYSVANPVIDYNIFVQRCRNNKHKLNRELMEKLIMKPIVWYTDVIDDKWRECSYCRVYKTRDNFYTNKFKDNWYCPRCIDCHNKRISPDIQKVVYTTNSKYVSPFKVRPRKWKLLSVKDIAIMEWIDKKYCPNIRQLLSLWRDIEKVIARYK